MNPPEIYEAAIKKFGEERQLLMVLEEMSEFATEVCHLLRGRVDLNVEEEYADLIIMLDQFAQIMVAKHPSFREDVVAIYTQKLDRLAKRVEG